MEAIATFQNQNVFKPRLFLIALTSSQSYGIREISSEKELYVEIILSNEVLCIEIFFLVLKTII